MTFYWILFLIPVTGRLISSVVKPAHDKALWFSMLLVSILFIGLRYDQGCDWDTYLTIHESIVSDHTLHNLEDLWSTTLYLLSPTNLLTWLRGFANDPALIVLSLISSKLGLGAYGVNVVCASIVVFCLSAFCRRTLDPWLAWGIATPYFLIVVSMGYTRQSVAIALFAYSIKFLTSRRILAFVSICLFAALFHKSILAILLLSLIYFAKERTKVRSTVIWLTSFVLLAAMVAPSLLDHYFSYLEGRWHSKGAYIRSAMNLVPALIFLRLEHLFPISDSEKYLWKVLSYSSIVLFFMVFIETTPVDRMGLYLIPIQIFVLSCVPQVIAARPWSAVVSALIFFVYATVMVVWFSGSLNARCWLPYQNALF